MKKILLSLILVLSIALAGCEDPVVIEEYIVLFESNGGTTIEQLVVEQGHTFLEPAQPTKEGYTFRGWYLESTLETPYDFSQRVEQDTTLYADWEQDEILVTFESQGAIYQQHILDGEMAIAIPTEPYREGYIFEGWYIDSSFTTEHSFDDTITETTTIYAKWTEMKILKIILTSHFLDINPGVIEGIEESIKTELNAMGHVYHEVQITLKQRGDASVYLMLLNGDVDVAMLEADQYVEQYDSTKMELLLTATYGSPSSDVSLDPVWWNQNEPHNHDDYVQTPSFRSPVIAGPSVKGRELASIINAGNDLTFEDIETAAICVWDIESPLGYLFPNLWLYDNFGHTLDELPNVITVGGFIDTFVLLEQQACDIGIVFPGARYFYTNTYGDWINIFQDTDIIGFTREIANTAVVVNKDTVSQDVQAALSTIMIDLAASDDYELYNVIHVEGFAIGDDSIYDGWREALAIDSE